MIEGVGFWLRYVGLLLILIVVARAFYVARRDERRAREWSDEKRCLASLRKMSRRP